LTITAPVTALPGTLTGKVQLKLVRCERAGEPNVLIAAADVWRDFVLAAPAVRLKPLKLALSESQALIWGSPVPSIPGERFVESDGIAAPCGFTLHPLSDPEIIRPLLRAADGD